MSCLGLWTNFLLDTDKALDDVYGQCVRAGPECALYENSTEAVKERVEKLLERLAEYPLAYYASSSDTRSEAIDIGDDGLQTIMGAAPAKYEVVTAEKVKSMLFNTLFVPHATAKDTLDVIAHVERGDPEAVWAASIRRVIDRLLQCDCGSAAPPTYRDLEVAYAIMGSDANLTVASKPDAHAAKEVLKEVEKTSWFAEFMWFHIPTAYVGTASTLTTKLI